jgi:hypothetical protein
MLAGCEMMLTAWSDGGVEPELDPAAHPLARSKKDKLAIPTDKAFRTLLLMQGNPGLISLICCNHMGDPQLAIQKPSSSKGVTSWH